MWRPVCSDVDANVDFELISAAEAPAGAVYNLWLSGCCSTAAAAAAADQLLFPCMELTFWGRKNVSVSVLKDIMNLSALNGIRKAVQLFLGEAVLSVFTAALQPSV